jgi:hypothetical protein
MTARGYIAPPSLTDAEVERIQRSNSLIIAKAEHELAKAHAKAAIEAAFEARDELARVQAEQEGPRYRHSPAVLARMSVAQLERRAREREQRELTLSTTPKEVATLVHA